MYGQGDFSVIQDLEASLQGRVGIFLQAKSKLTVMSSSPVLTISDKAKNLYQVQVKPESDLTDTLNLVNKVKTDVYTAPDIVSISGFYLIMEKHISDVDSLYNEYVGTPGAQSSLIAGVDSKTLMIIGAVGLGLYLMGRK